jgi:hypothetical protein
MTYIMCLCTLVRHVDQHNTIKQSKPIVTILKNPYRQIERYLTTCRLTVQIGAVLDNSSSRHFPLVPPLKNRFAAFLISDGSVRSSAWNLMVVYDDKSPL